MTLLAIAVSVGYLSCVLITVDSYEENIESVFSTAYAGSDLVIEPDATSTGIDESLVAAVREIPDVAEAEGFTLIRAEILSRNGQRPVPSSPRVRGPIGGSWVESDTINPFRIATGRPPQGPDEVVIDRGSAQRNGYEVGDQLPLLTTNGIGQFTVVGVARFLTADSPGGLEAALLWPPQARQLSDTPGTVSQIHIAVSPGADTDAVAMALAKLIDVAGAGATIETSSEFVSGEVDDLQRVPVSDLYLENSLLAVVGSGFVVLTSLTFLMRRRRQHLALLRAVGAMPGQLVRIVVLEAIGFGVLGGLVGWMMGLGAARVLVAIVDRQTSTSTSLVGLPEALFAGLGLGLVTAVVGAAAPALAVLRLHPVAAVTHGAGDIGPAPLRTSGRDSIAALAILGGSGLTILLDLPSSISLAVALGSALLLMPRILTAVAGFGPWNGKRWRRRSSVTALALTDLATAPRRTAAVCGPVLAAVAITSLFATQSASHTAALRREADDLSQEVDADYVVWDRFAADVEARLDDLDEVASVTRLRSVRVEWRDRPVNVISLRSDDATEVFGYAPVRGSLAQMGAGTVALPSAWAEANGLDLGDRIAVEAADGGTTELGVGAIYLPRNEDRQNLLVSPEAFDAHFDPDELPTRLWLRFADGVTTASAERALAGVLEAYPQAMSLDLRQPSANYSDSWVPSRYQAVLLGVTVLVAIVSIINGIVLAAFERRRSHTLLRAVGASRRQLAASLRRELLVATTIASLLGATLGAGTAWVDSLMHPASTVFRLPIGTIGPVAGLAIGVAALAAAYPAWWSSRRSVVAGLSTTT